MAYSIQTDRKWQKIWKDTNLNKFHPENIDKKLYCLEMFTYPSGAKLHVGHWYNFGPCDSWARMKKMQGYEVFQPMGFDAFGLPAENYAIKTGIHPQDSTLKNIETMQQQLKEIGAMYDWDYETITCLPDYYKWTQWLFLQLFKENLAYRKEAPVNWCPKCQTVLANEQVIDGECERCSAEVTKKNLTQWFFKITAYAQELLDKLDDLDWPEKTKKAQKNWIGRSEGSEISFKVQKHDLSFKVFTTRADTLLGVTYVVLAPEHELVNTITTDEHKKSVDEYIEVTRKKSEIERLSTEIEKTGVFTGAYAIHPITNEAIPIWISDYVIGSYGTGSVMAVPAHDERDFDFAKKFSLPIKQVIKNNNNATCELPFVEFGTLISSGEFTNMSSSEAIVKIVEKLELEGLANRKVNYRLRDWLVSRQRYWGAPIPIIHCEKCGLVPVAEKDLPVLLPYDVVFAPDGESPLKKSAEFINTTCPICGGHAERDPDTLDTFVCSSWYYLRYPDNKNSNEPFNRDLINKMLPVDKYIGGPEHAVMHLLYSRFITKALRDLGFLNFDEPFKSLVHQGIILGPDGNRMSKSKGNTISPDEYVSEYGADVFRLYLMFGFSYTDGGPWSDDGLKAISRFIARIEKIVDRLISIRDEKGTSDFGAPEKELNYHRHISIKGITEDAEKFQFNTTVARFMELLNALYKYDSEETVKNAKIFGEVISDFLIMLAPFAPHFIEEVWEKLGYSYSVFNNSWPKWKSEDIIKDEVEIAIQINGAIKCKVIVPSNADDSQVEKIVLNEEKLKPFLENKRIIKLIIVKNRLVNIVVK